MYVISVPISVPVSKKKKFYLNLNQYRNAHHFTLSKAKTNYHDIVAPLLRHLPTFTRINLVYTLFVGSQQLCDTSNICSIVDKFFSDVLVDCKKIPDDNRDFVLSARYCFGGVDKHHPRVEVTILPDDNCPGQPVATHDKKENNMQIIIVQADIEEAIRAYILERITIREEQQIDIDLKATRGDDGYQAIIDIVNRKPETKTPAAKASAAAPAKAKAVARQSTMPTPVAKAQPPVVEPEVAEAEVTQTAVEDEQGNSETVEVESTATVQEDTAEEAPETAEEPAPAAQTRPSLFANLKQPANA